MAIVNQGDISEISKTLEYKKKPRKNPVPFNASAYLKALVGVDLCAIPGVSELTAMEFVSEVGTDMGKFKSIKHFAAWLNLTPNTKITGGKVMSSRVMKKKNKAGQCLKMEASTLYSNKSPLGDFYRRMRGKFGGKGAALATAHKISRIIYIIIKNKKKYNVNMLEENQKRFNNLRIKRLEKQLQKLKNAA